MTLLEIKDIAGLSKPLSKLIEVIAQGVGTISKPYLIRKTADAKAYEIKKLSSAIEDGTRTQLQAIDYKNEKLSLKSLSKDNLKQNLSIASRAENRSEYQEQKRQQNIENVTSIAATQLQTEEDISDDKVDEDWTTRFFNYAQDISNEEMQDIWGRVLAGEIKRPQSFSLRTLDMLRNISKEEAQTFSKIAKYAITCNGNTFILKGTNSDILEEFGVSFREIALLEELDLLHSGDFVTFNLRKTSNQNQMGFQFGSTIVMVIREANAPDQSISIKLFTKIGCELLNLITDNPDFKYIQRFAKELKNENVKVKYGAILEKNAERIRFANLLKDVPELKE